MGQDIVNYDKAFAAAAEQYAKQDRSGEGSYFSTRGGILALGEDQMPGNQIAAVIIDSYLENAFFEGKFDPNNIVPPQCYAFTRGDPEEMFPHIESMEKGMDYFIPQNFDGAGNVLGCKGCPKAEWGSSETGRGKACKNQYRLALLPAGIYQQAPNRRDWELSVFDDEAHYRSSDIVHLKLPVTSGGAFERYRKSLRTQHARPPYGALTRIYLTPDQKNQFSVNFELIELLPNELAAAVIGRNTEIVSAPFKGYEAPDPEKQNAPAGPGRFGGGSNFRRK